jgi:hypothetical protein
MAKTAQTSPVVTTSLTNLITLRSLEEKYVALHKFEKEAGQEQQFYEKFGTKKQFLGQFKRQPYDKVGGK